MRIWYVDGGAHIFIEPLQYLPAAGKRLGMNLGFVLLVLSAIPTNCLEVGRTVHYNWIAKRIILLLFGAVIRANHYIRT